MEIKEHIYGYRLDEMLWLLKSNTPEYVDQYSIDHIKENFIIFYKI